MATAGGHGIYAEIWMFAWKKEDQQKFRRRAHKRAPPNLGPVHPASGGFTTAKAFEAEINSP